MPRHPRIHAPGLLYHLMVRGNNGQPTFLDQTDYDGYLKALRTTRGRYPFRLYAYRGKVSDLPNAILSERASWRGPRIGCGRAYGSGERGGPG